MAVALARGKTIRDIMVATGRSESTIRWHIKHIYAKHGLSRQAELVQLVMLVTGSPGPCAETPRFGGRQAVLMAATLIVA